MNDVPVMAEASTIQQQPISTSIVVFYWIVEVVFLVVFIQFTSWLVHQLLYIQNPNDFDKLGAALGSALAGLSLGPALYPYYRLFCITTWGRTAGNILTGTKFVTPQNSKPTIPYYIKRNWFWLVLTLPVILWWILNLVILDQTITAFIGLPLGGIWIILGLYTVQYWYRGRTQPSPKYPLFMV